MFNNAHIESKMEALFTKKKVFLNPKCTINEIAKQIDESPKVISTYIDETYKLSFKHYLMQCRIEEFKKLVLEKDNKYDLYGIAQEAGFNSKASFYRAFKKYEGITPGEYRNKFKIETS